MSPDRDDEGESRDESKDEPKDEPRGEKDAASGAGPKSTFDDAARATLESLGTQLVSGLGKFVTDLKADAARMLRDAGPLGRALLEVLGPLVQATRANPRAARLVGEATSIFSAYRVAQSAASSYPPERAAEERERLDRKTAERAVQACVELGGVMPALGQLASARADMLPVAWVDELSRLTDARAPSPFEAIAERVRQEIGAPLSSRFSVFDAQPFASTSLVQVHAAVLLDGTRVAVKIHPPGLEQQAEGDLATLDLLATIGADLVRPFDLSAVLGELTRSLREELDYRLEAERARGFVADLAGDPGLVLPRIHADLSTAGMITLDRIEGERLATFLEGCGARGDAGADDRDAVLTTLVRTIGAQILAHGRFQCDRDPSHFLVSPDRRIGIPDYGPIHVIEPELRRSYASLCRAIARGERDQIPAVLIGLGLRARAPEPAPEAMAAIVDLLIDAFGPVSAPRPAAPVDAPPVDPRIAFEGVLFVASDSDIAVPTHFILVGRLVASLAALIAQHKPRIDASALLAPYLDSAAPAPAPTA